MTDEREFGVLEEVMAEGCQSKDRTFNGFALKKGYVRNVFDFSQDDTLTCFYGIISIFIFFWTFTSIQIKRHASTGKNTFFRFVTLDICVQSK